MNCFASKDYVEGSTAFTENREPKCRDLKEPPNG